MLVHVILNFDDVVFPTTLLLPFYRPDTGDFLLPAPLQEPLDQLDRLLHRVVQKHMDHARFRLLTRASPAWVQACLKLLPRVQRYVEWRYLEVLTDEDTTRQRQMRSILSKDRRYDMYVFLGYDVDEEVAWPESLRQQANIRWRVLLFVRKPSMVSLLYEWHKVEGLFSQFLTSNEPVVRQHFVVQDDCQRPYASPGWYTGTPAVATAVSPVLTAHPPGPMSPTGVFVLPRSPPMLPLDKTLRRPLDEDQS